MESLEKANELVEKFNIISYPTNGWYSMSNYQSIKCAIIAVDEILITIQDWHWMNEEEYIEKTGFWQEVKQHLEEML